MPSLTREEVRLWALPGTKIFVETGTYQGDTVNEIKEDFAEVHSIELGRDLASRAAARFSDQRHVHIHEGDSKVILPAICARISETTFFWLDGHWSCGITARGNEDVPLLGEIKAIVERCAPACVLAIDDVRLFGKTDGAVDWRGITVEAILALVCPRLQSLYFRPSSINRKDRLIIQLSDARPCETGEN